VEVKIVDLALKDQDSRLTEEDVDPSAFRLYTGDGTPAEEFFGTECEVELGRFNKDHYLTTANLRLNFHPTKTADTESEMKAIVQDMVDSLKETEPYVVYTDPSGETFTLPVRNG